MAATKVNSAEIADLSVDTNHIKANAITAPKIVGIDKSNLTTDSDPFKFRVYRNAAANSGNGGFVKIAFDTEIFDTNNNFTSGTYTVPITGFYQIDWSIRFAVNSVGCVAALYINGGASVYGTQQKGNSSITVSSGGALIQLTAGSTLEVYAYGDSTTALDAVGFIANLFSGYLHSQT